MSGHKNFKELEAQVLARPGAEERLAQIRVETMEALTLAQLRKARQLTQAQLALALETGQGHVSRLERQTDLYLSTLRSYVEAMGGQLEVRAVFEDADVLVERLGDEEAEFGGTKLVSIEELPNANVPSGLAYRLLVEADPAAN